MKRLLLALSFGTSGILAGPGLAASDGSMDAKAPGNAPASAPTTASPTPAASQSKSQGSPNLKNPALQKLYRKGVEAYEAKRYDEAVDALTQLLAKQPDYAPAKIYLGRSYYQQRNIPDAYKAFSGVDLKEMQPDAAYDYGQVAFRSNDDASALKAFSQVPNGHALYDLAGYFGGIAALRSGEYQRAIDMFDQAVVLPSKLTASQKKLRREAEKKLLQKPKGEKDGSGVAGTKSAPAAAPTDFILNPVRAAEVSYRYMNQTVDTKKSLSTAADITRADLTAAWGSDRPANAKRQWYYQGTLTAEAVNHGEAEVLLLSTARSSLENSVLTAKQTKMLWKPEIAGGYETLLGDKATIGGSLGAYAFVADSDFAKRIGYAPYASIFIAQKTEALEMRLTGESHPQFDTKELQLTRTLEEALINFNFTKNASIGLRGELDEFSYNARRLSGPDWLGRFQLQLGYKQDKAFDLLLSAFYEIDQGQRLYDSSPDVPLLKFNQSQAGAIFKAQIHLTAWWLLGISGQYALRDYASAVPDGATEYLDQSYGSKITQFSAYTAFTKTF